MKFPTAVILSLIAPALSAETPLHGHCKPGVKMITLDFTADGSGGAITCDATGSCLLTATEVGNCKNAITGGSAKILYGTKATKNGGDGTKVKKVADLGKHLLTTPSSPTTKIAYDGLNIDVSDLDATQFGDLMDGYKGTKDVVLTLKHTQWATLGAAIDAKSAFLHHVFVIASAADEVNKLDIGTMANVDVSIIFTGKPQDQANTLYHGIDQAHKAFFKGHASVTDVAAGAFAEAFNSC